MRRLRCMTLIYRGSLKHPLRRLARHLVLDLMLLVAIAVLATIVLDRRTQDAEQLHAADATRSAVRQMQATLELQVTLNRASLKDMKFPQSFDPAWFEGTPPRNALVGETHPWVEIASADEVGLRHPRDITVEGGRSAMFWYNPALGIVRARVPRSLTDASAIALYNDVNGTKLVELWAVSLVEDRE